MATGLLLPVQPALAGCDLHRAASLKLTLWQDKLFVPVSIEGSAQLMAVDTGAGVSVLSSATAAALNISHDFDHTADTAGLGGADSHLYIGEVHSLEVGAIRLSDRRIPIADFAMRMADGTPMAGLLGADILRNFDVDIDFAGRRLDLWLATGCAVVQPAWHGLWSSVPMTLDASLQISVPVRIGAMALRLTLDTGAPGLLLTRRAAARIGVAPDLLDQDRAVSGIGVNDKRFAGRMHIFQRLQLGSQVFGDVPAMVVDNARFLEKDGLLGLTFLRRSKVWLSYSTGTMFLQENAF